jgi:BMFP domain-containing protein YqiC
MSIPNSTFLHDISERLSALLANSPAQDIEKNVRAMLASAFSKLDLVTREEFDVQREVLSRTRAKLEAMETRLAELEARSKSSGN